MELYCPPLVFEHMPFHELIFFAGLLGIDDCRFDRRWRSFQLRSACLVCVMACLARRLVFRVGAIASAGCGGSVHDPPLLWYGPSEAPVIKQTTWRDFVVLSKHVKHRRKMVRMQTRDRLPAHCETSGSLRVWAAARIEHCQDDHHGTSPRDLQARAAL